jgi:hypothetical protein
MEARAALFALLTTPYPGEGCRAFLLARRGFVALVGRAPGDRSAASHYRLARTKTAAYPAGNERPGTDRGSRAEYLARNRGRHCSPAGETHRRAEYGRPNLEMDAALECLGACVTPIAIYRWQLPSDLAPLREAAQRLAAHQFDVVLFTSAIQLEHLWEVVRDLGMEEDVRLALRVVIASVGPVMTASLEAQGLTADIVPKHPKMAALVHAASDLSAAVLARKREARS